MYGDSELVRRRAAALRDQGADVRALADELVARLDDLGWSGRTADAFRGRVLDRSRHLRVAADRHQTAADALAAHAVGADRALEEIATRERRANGLVEAARSRRAASDAGSGSVEPGDAELLSFTPPPRGHRDWLAVELPGLDR
ncbi:hypothetical protein ACFQ0K_10410 [Nocardioides caeni]|uniref:WXG100 family type VII secretion target n=1 Tax=Nocardioides caeni TaxID=574700 RepID=A0A4S8N0M3_9ACTN|nr:hypothetical protein [Nocardioides caeni]THV09318.1 hypothetical protein E9934_16380 [Nocardioides caeni]